MRVVDIGAGNNPIKQADVYVDKYPEDDTHRRGILKVPTDKTFIKADVQDLSMFAEDEFDFVNCTHVLEHVEEPWVAMDELMRIGKSGYVEFPSFIAERLIFGSPNHKWAIVSFFDTMVYNRSCGRPYNNSRIKFKMFRGLDFLLNTAHTKACWGHGKAIKYRFRNESTNSVVRKIENFLSMTMGICTQNLINIMLFLLKEKVRVR